MARLDALEMAALLIRHEAMMRVLKSDPGGVEPMDALVQVLCPSEFVYQASLRAAESDSTASHVSGNGFTRAEASEGQEEAPRASQRVWGRTLQLSEGG